MVPTPSALPFDDIRSLIATMPEADGEARAAVKARDATLLKPAGALGRLEGIAEWMAGWQGKATPTVARPLVAVFAANHGVVDAGVAAFPSDVTRIMVETFTAGGGAINQLCLAYDLGLKVFDLALDVPTPNIVEADAFSEAECVATIAFGMEAVAGGSDGVPWRRRQFLRRRAEFQRSRRGG